MLTPSVISSYDPRGFLHPDFELWDSDGDRWVELYCFMGYDGRQLLLELVPDADSQSPAQVMRHMTMGLGDAAVDLVAKRIDRFIDEQDISLCGFATFLPEASHHEDEIRDLAIDHLVFLVELAVRLNDGRAPKPITIEIVSGSKFGKFNASVGAKVGIEQRVDKLGRLFDALEQVIRRTEEAKVNFAIEMEPGDMYVVGSADEMASFCDMVDDSGDAELMSRIGFNLDIGHWSLLEQMSIADWKAEKFSRILNRIVHCHVSVQDKGHFGDLRLGVGESVKVISNWIEFLIEIGEGKFDIAHIVSPKFDGFVSLELEAVKSLSIVNSSFTKLVRLLRDALAAKGKSTTHL